MAVLSTIKLAGAVALVGSLNMGVGATTFLAPEQDIALPSSDTASEPLEWLGANSPYFAGELFLLLFDCCREMRTGRPAEESEVERDGAHS